MKIASWNINSVRARTDRLLAWLSSFQPDVLCLQEIKCQDEQFPRAEVEALGYEVATFGEKTYNGVAILARGPIETVARGLLDGVEDPQSRLMGGTVNGVRIFSVYAPNGQRLDSPAYQYKLEWFRRLRAYLDRHHSSNERLVLCGDFNVAPEDRDVHDPDAWEGSVLVTPAERAALATLCAFPLTDTFRQHHQDSGRFSWWDFRSLGFPRNAGLRIDHLLATPPLAASCTDAGIDRDARKGKQPSDHAPVWADFTV